MIECRPILRRPPAGQQQYEYADHLRRSHAGRAVRRGVSRLQPGCHQRIPCPSRAVSQPPFPILLLTTIGARTGRPANVPLGYAVDGRARVFVVASKAGAPWHPAWFHNLRANPSVTVELGGRTYPARALVTAGEERDRLYRL